MHRHLNEIICRCIIIFTDALKWAHIYFNSYSKRFNMHALFILSQKQIRSKHVCDQITDTLS